MQLGLYCSSTMFTASSASRRRFLDPSAPIVLRTPVSWGSEPPVPQTASDARHHPSTTAPRRFFLQELRACQKGLSFHVLLSDLSRKANLSYPIYLPELWRQSVSLCFARDCRPSVLSRSQLPRSPLRCHARVFSSMPTGPLGSLQI